MIPLRQPAAFPSAGSTGGHGPFAAGARPAYILLAAMAALIAILVRLLGCDIDRHDVPTMIAVQASFVGAAFLLRSRGMRRSAAGIEAAVLILAATMATACLCVLLATTAFPYRDALLDRADRIIMPLFGWGGMFEALRAHSTIVSAMCRIYQTLLWQPFVLVTALAAIGQERRCWQFVHAWFVTLAICVVIFPFVPAAGEYVYRGLSNADIPALTVDTAWRQFAVLQQIRSGVTLDLTPTHMTGIIAFPSFHAAGATLLAWGFRRLPVIGVPFMLLDIAMAATAPLVGAHYFVDIIAGIAVALLAIRIATYGGRDGRDGGAGGVRFIRP